MSRRKSIEAVFDSSFGVEEKPEGTRIYGRLAYPGISKNGKLYTIEQLVRGADLNLPVWLNHADLIGVEDIGPDLLPDSYRARLANKEKIILGKVHTQFNPQTLELLYDGMITDPFYKQKKVLKRMAVSQGVWHPLPDPGESPCDKFMCYQLIRESYYEEMSLVFHPGFSIMTLSIENDQSYNIGNLLDKYMSADNNTKSKEGCGCAETKAKEALDKAKEILGNAQTEFKKAAEAAGQASGVMSEAGNCGEGEFYDVNDGKCKPVNTSGNAESNGSNPDVTNSGEATDEDGREMKEFGKIKKAKEGIDTARKSLESAKEEFKKATEALIASNKSKEVNEESEPEDKKRMQVDKKEKSGENNKWVVPEGSGPNADTGSRAKAQEQYNKALENHYKAIEAAQIASESYVRQSMLFSAEHASGKAIINSQTEKDGFMKSKESAEMNPKQWIDQIIKSPESAAWNKTWFLKGPYMESLVTRKFKKADEGVFLSDRYIPYNEVMKSIEAFDVTMAPGTSTGDVNNFQRTMSELVLVYPDGIIVTPIQPFCETAILGPGKKQHIFYDVNIPTFSAIDETNMDAGGGGYALQASTVTINASGGSTTPQGGMVRIAFTQLEELPIDIIQKVNIGFAMRAEERKNFEVLTTCYNTDTAYAPTTDSIKPKGGGAKTALDSSGNAHWVNGNSAAQITTDDTAATSALTFAGLLAAKKTIAETGLTVENLQTFLPYGGILQLLKDTGITTYTQRAVPEVITEGYIEKISGTQLIASSSCADGLGTGTKRAVMFLPIVSFGFVTGRELQIDAERVARQQSVFATASMKMAAFCKKVESTCRISFKPAA
jgi:hypothetical protein